MENCIETHGLTKLYDGLVAVNNIELRVERGSFYGFLGPNGAGKTTTIRMLTGLTAPSSGSAQLLGYDLASDPLEIKRRTGVLLEEPCLFENLTAREYLTFIARMYQVPKKEIADRCDELLTLIGLADTEKTLILEFSHGMKKKLSLTAALIHNPQLLFLDEPFEGIDPIASRTIRRVLDRLIQRGSTIFLTSHILEIVEKLSTHVGIIHKGKLVSEGPLEEVAGGASLEEVFVSAVGEPEQVEASLSWLDGDE
jgi:ABC-2 type transport system ATP-binding protein